MTFCSVQVLGDESHKSQHIAASHGNSRKEHIKPTHTKKDHHYKSTILYNHFGVFRWFKGTKNMNPWWSWWLASENNSYELVLGGNNFSTPTEPPPTQDARTTRTIAFLLDSHLGWAYASIAGMSRLQNLKSPKPLRIHTLKSQMDVSVATRWFFVPQDGPMVLNLETKPLGGLPRWNVQINSGWCYQYVWIKKQKMPRKSDELHWNFT